MATKYWVLQNGKTKWVDAPDLDELTASVLAGTTVQTNVANTFTASQVINTGAVPLTVIGDGVGGSGFAQIVLQNKTTGATPKSTPGITFSQDGTAVWQWKGDVQAGAQNDLALYGFTAAIDFIYITDTATPGMVIGAGADRSGATNAQLKVQNLSTTRPTLRVIPKPGTTSPTMVVYRGDNTQTANILEFRDAGNDALLARVASDGSWISSGSTALSGSSLSLTQTVDNSTLVVTRMSGQVTHLAQFKDSTGIDSLLISAGGTLTFHAGVAANPANLYRSAADTLKTDDSFHVTLDFRHLGANLGFYNTAPVAKQTINGSRGGNAALADLLTKLALVGLIADGSTA